MATPLWKFDKVLTKKQDDVITTFFTYAGSKIIFNCHTGFGKTIVSLYLCSFFQSTCILVAQKTVYDQWLLYLKNLPVQVMTTWPTREKFSGILIMMIPTACNRIKNKSCSLTVDLLIIDEIHTRIKQYTVLHESITYTKLLGLTATLPTSKHVDYEMYKIIFKGACKISRVEIKKFQYKFIETGFKPTPKNTMFYCKSFNKWIRTVNYLDLTRQCRDDPVRTQKICNFILKTIGDSGLILTKYVKTAIAIHDLLKTHQKPSQLITSTTCIPDYHNIIVGTYSKLSIGFDTKKTKIYILDNIDDIRQSIGRLRNHDYIVYDIIDAHPMFLKHMQTRKEFYIKIGGTVIKNPLEY
jgi:superfamily II DNA or RNA helicase